MSAGGSLQRPLQRPQQRHLRRQLWREPLLHFLAIGALLCAAVSFQSPPDAAQRIVVTPQQVSRLEQQYHQQFGTAPSAERREWMVRQYLREEALYRRGMALGLADEDVVVRRRIAQKMAFVLEDRVAPDPPSESQLRAFYREHSQRYGREPRVDFEHVYFSPDSASDASSGSSPAGAAESARERAEEALRRYRQTGAQPGEHGDRFPGRERFAALTPERAANLFGRGALAQQLFSGETGVWRGPYRSGYGWHLLRIEALQPGGPAPYEAVAEAVRADWLAAERERREEQALTRLLNQYKIVRRDSTSREPSG